MVTAQRAQWIAIVEDDLGMREGLSWLLTAARFHVVSFASAEDFLKQSVADRIDCLLVDVWLPGINGVALNRAMSEAGRHIPTLFMSGHDDATTRDLFHRAGVTRWLTKPFDGQTLIDAVHDAIGPSQ